jgi:hypothetical protein
MIIEYSLPIFARLFFYSFSSLQFLFRANLTYQGLLLQSLTFWHLYFNRVQNLCHLDQSYQVTYPIHSFLSF